MRISEIYTSIQGEGPNVGKPVQFIRFAGCNLRCPAWPCDTQHAIDPKYRAEWEVVTPEDVYKRVKATPNNIVYTGGEPFLQPMNELRELTMELRDQGYEIEAFTNGTLPWPIWSSGIITMVMDWKLPGSGEATHVPNREKNVKTMTSGDSIKFTVASYEDFQHAVKLWEEARGWWAANEYGPHVYVGAVWGKVPEADVAEWLIASKLPWKLNVQVHNHIWDRALRGI